ncbi:MAG: hypothetical protein ACI906_002332 [Candidatus Latescibacterota bacterium]
MTEFKEQTALGTCVYCGSRSGKNPNYTETARLLGTALGNARHPLVYGGGSVGLMGTLADAALAAGGTVTGVIPREMVEREWAHPTLSELLVVKDMHQRKAAMAARARIFVALPGGFGTLEELAEILSWAQLQFHSHPLYLINTCGYFDALLAFLDHCVTEQFATAAHRSLLKIVDDVEDLFTQADYT